MVEMENKKRIYQKSYPLAVVTVNNTIEVFVKVCNFKKTSNPDRVKILADGSGLNQSVI